MVITPLCINFGEMHISLKSAVDVWSHLSYGERCCCVFCRQTMKQARVSSIALSAL